MRVLLPTPKIWFLLLKVVSGLGILRIGRPKTARWWVINIKGARRVSTIFVERTRWIEHSANARKVLATVFSAALFHDNVNQRTSAVNCA